jgi:hypothetical protein
LKVCWPLLFIFYAPSLFPQSARALGMGNASSGIRDEWAVFHNAAGLAWHDKSFACGSILNHYFMKELTLKRGAAGLIKNGKAAAVSLSQMGDYRLKTSTASALYSQLFGKAFSMAATLTYEELAFTEDYGKKGVFYVSIAFLVKAGSSDYFSFLIKNPSRQVLDQRYQEKVETSIVTAHTHTFSSLFTATVEVEKNLTSEVNFKLGFEYQARKSLILRAGYEMDFRRTCFGFSFHRKHFSLDLAFSYEGRLGFNSAVGGSYTFIKKS